MGISLHDSVVGEGPDVVLLHGLFAQGSNLGMIARGLQEEFRVHSLDLPDHGHSDWSSAPSLSHYAEAVSAWMDDRHLTSAHIVGHSLGGKVGMQLALTEPAKVDKLVIADIAPVAYPAGHQAVFAGLAAVAAASCASRQQAAKILAEHINEAAVVQFLLLSLKRMPDGHYQWRLNREGLAAGYDSFVGALNGDQPFDGEALFIHGAESSYVQPEHLPAIERWFTHYQLEAIEGTGHWLHAEKTAEFNRRVLEFLL